MDIREHNIRLDTLEAMVDKIGLGNLLDCLAEVASAKAEHVRTNWQDETLASDWDRKASVLVNAALKCGAPL